MTEIINGIAPILILLIVGVILRKTGLISAQTVVDLKKIVVNLALPAVLFTSFLNMDLQRKYFWFLPVLFGYCLLLYFLGRLIQHFRKSETKFFPFLITGFEAGMIGVSLFGAAYGLEEVGKFAIIDLGQEFFIWFVYVALLIHQREGQTKPLGLIKMFATSPVIIGVLAGLILNLVGLPRLLGSTPILQGILSTVNLIGGLTVPLILMVVGYGIQLDLQELLFSARVILIRLAINIPVALLLNRFFVRGWLQLDIGFEAALFTMLILPPPFILTLFMKSDQAEDIHRIDNTLTLHTLVSIVVFIIYFALNPTI